MGKATEVGRTSFPGFVSSSYRPFLFREVHEPVSELLSFKAAKLVGLFYQYGVLSLNLI